MSIAFEIKVSNTISRIVIIYLQLQSLFLHLYIFQVILFNLYFFCIFSTLLFFFHEGIIESYNLCALHGYINYEAGTKLRLGSLHLHTYQTTVPIVFPVSKGVDLVRVLYLPQTTSIPMSVVLYQDCLQVYLLVTGADN